jgi:YidC/Oxa1 family membrane protein insertase
MQGVSWLEGTIIYDFFYNALMFLTAHMPALSIGLAVIVLTILVKLILSPLSYKSIINQVQQKKLQPKIKAVQAKYKDNKELQAQKVMEIYKEHKTNPLAGCFLLLIQIPIIISLYAVFVSGLSIQPDLLYNFVPVPADINTQFMGVNLAGQSLIFAIITGLSQLVQVLLSPAMKSYTDDKKDTEVAEQETDTQGKMAEQIQKSMRFTLPIMIGVFAYLVPAAVALYWIVNNVFTVVQELVISRKLAYAQKHAK